MQPLIAPIRFLRDATCSLRINSHARSRWTRRLQHLAANRFATSDNRVRTRLQRWARVGAGGRMLRARMTSGTHTLAVRLKWCPTADPVALDATVRNMRWWRLRHPELCKPVADILDYWPEERVLVLEERAGLPLNVSANTAPTSAAHLAAWLRAYADSMRRYEDDIAPRLLATVNRESTGTLTCAAVPLLESRIASAERAAAELARLGFPRVRDWAQRFDMTAILRAFAARQPAGFVHGDLKPGNVLVSAGDFSVVDWWIAPCVSWPLTDLASFAGSLLLDGSPAARQVWRHFGHAYYPNGIDSMTLVAIELIAAAMCINYCARRATNAPTRMVERSRIQRVLERVCDPHVSIAGFSELVQAHPTERHPLPKACAP